MSGDGELRLSIMATLAQEESRKISERVRAGQNISRKNGVLYGTGNILGYDRKDGTYVVNPEQAYSVRKVFELYAYGLGYQKICNELMRLGCKNASGQVQWSVDRIGRILRNPTYKGYTCYNKSHRNNYLEQKRINHRDEEFVCIKGDFDPIVSEELWDRCHEIRLRKSSAQRDENGNTRKIGRREPQSVWSNLLRCSCGSAFARFTWHTNEDGKKAYGFECYRQKRSATASYLRKHGLDASIACEEKSIPEWHLNLMAYTVFKNIWGDQKDAVLLACQMIEECAVTEQRSSCSVAEGLNRKLDRLKKQQSGLREMRALGDITREEFQEDNMRLQQEIDSLESQIADLDATKESAESPINMDKIKATLNQWVDLSGPVIPDALIEQYILQVVVEETNVFNWTLNLDCCTTGLIPPSEIARRQYHEQRTNGAIDSMLSEHITNPQTVWGMVITEEHSVFLCMSCTYETHLDCNVNAETILATETQAGKTVHTATVQFNEKTYTDVRTEIIPATGHTEHIADTSWLSDSANHWHKCAGCEEILDLAAHFGGVATCMGTAVCEVCGESYGEKDPQNHTGKTTLSGKKDATCCEAGYSGDIICECGNTVTKGKVLPATKNHSFTEYRSDGNATCKKNGTKTAKCDYGCGKTDTITDRGSKLGHKFDGDKCVRCGVSRWNPDTGDKIMIAVAVLVISGGALLLLLSKKKRK